MSGPIPTELGGMSNLVLLHIGTKPLGLVCTVYLSDSIMITSILFSVFVMMFSFIAYNGITGSLPSEIGEMGNLAGFNFGTKHLVFCIVCVG